jgi:hypothetical protein
MAIRTFSVNTTTGVFAPELPYRWGIIKRQLYQTANLFDPDVVKMDDRGDGISRLGHEIPWRNFWKHTLEINGAGEKSWILSWEAALFNNNQDPDVREIDITQDVSSISQTFRGNLVAIDGETANKVRFVSYKYNMDTSSLTPNDNFSTKPWLYRLASAVNSYGMIRRIAGGILPFIPLVAYTELWMDKSEIMFLDKRPDTWTIENVLSSQ